VFAAELLPRSGPRVSIGRGSKNGHNRFSPCFGAKRDEIGSQTANYRVYVASSELSMATVMGNTQQEFVEDGRYLTTRQSAEEEREVFGRAGRERACGRGTTRGGAGGEKREGTD